MSWADDLDLLGSRRATWRGSWGLLAVAVLAVLAMNHRHDELLSEQRAVQQRLESARRLQAARQAPERPQASAATLEAAAAVAGRLSHPWPAVLARVETAAEGTALVALHHRAGEATVEIEAAATDDQAAWRFLQALGTGPGPIDKVWLVAREPMSSLGGGEGVHLHVQAHLADSSLQDGAP